MKENVIFSIIIPHKNSIELLNRCLNTIPDDELIQIIVIDDNSDSSKVDFMKFPRYKKDNLEIIFSKESRGAGFARNLGMDRAKGKWILFADADDYYTPNFFEEMLKEADSDADIIYFSLGEENKSFQGLEYQRYIECYDKNNQISVDHLKYKTWTPWSKMFNRAFILMNGIRFEPRPIGNDCFFVLTASQLARSIKVVKQPLYVHVFNDKSLSYTFVKSWPHEVERFTLAIWRFSFYKELGYQHWQEGGIYSYFFSIKKKFGYYKLLLSIIIAIKHRADFIYPILFKLYLKRKVEC